MASSEVIAIVGAGECGARAALELRQAGFDGFIRLYGEEQIPPYERPPLSKAALLNYEAHKAFASLQTYSENRIELHLDVRVEALETASRQLRLSGGRTHGYDRLLLATGSKPRKWPGADEKSERVVTLRTAQDAARLRRHLGKDRSLVIIGGGFIGMEVAATAATVGTDVTVIHAQPKILSRGVPEFIADVLAARHRKEGVDFRLGATVTAVVEREHAVETRLATGEVLKSDCVLIGIGATPEIGLAEVAGLEIDNGIAVNERLETSVPGIWAAGDCCSFLLDGSRVRLESWRNAHEHAVVAASNLAGEMRRLSSVPWFWTDQYDLCVQVAGFASPALSFVFRQSDDDAVFMFGLREDNVVRYAAALAKGNRFARDMKLAEQLIARGVAVTPQHLQDPRHSLKDLLRG